VRRRGDRIVNDGSHNRSQAQVNHPDPSKLLIEFETETDHPTIKGQIVPGQPARHHYNDTVDWASKENVDKLNRWRNQVFCRSLGRKREPRPRWSALEVDFICGILEEHLETVGGRFSGIDWEKVAQLFNKVMDGRVQKAGEATAMGRYKGSAVSRKTCLKTDRRAPVRSSQAVKAQFERFTDPWAKEILEKAKNVDIQSLRGRKYEGGT
jgi:hypothetical protein